MDRFTSGSSSGHSSSDHSSFGHYISCHSLSGHTPPDTIVVDSSAPPRVVYPPLTMALRCSKAYRHWRSASLSTMYLPTTSESSAGDSFSESSAGPSLEKECWAGVEQVCGYGGRCWEFECRERSVRTRWYGFMPDVMKRLEQNNDLAAYTQRFQELTMLCTKMVPEEEDRVERFISSLSDNIQGNVIAAEPTRLQDAIRIANNLMDQKLKGYAVKNAKNKRRLEVNQRDSRGQQPSFKRQNVRGQNVARAYTAGNNDKRGYVGPLPYCSKCKLHHEGPCTVKCGKCNKIKHMTRDYMNAVAASTTQRAPVVNQRVPTCFECGRQGHYMSECPKLKNQNRRNKSGNKSEIGEARGKAYVLGGGDANPGSNVVTGLLGHPFNIDLMPVELGSFDVIIGMDWLANHHAVIVCDEKIVRIPYGDKVLIVQGDSSDRGKKSNLSIISCTKTHKYIKRGCPIFLAQITKKETEDKSEEKRLEDVPMV
ncbi:putative reverse transcriptase domain-containing protein [Tanacetum coccineum]